MRRSLATVFVALALCSGTVVLGGTASAATATFPTVTGAFGATPTIAFNGAPAPTTLESKVLSLGNGPTVATGDLLVANYDGQIWGGKVFDSSFSRNETAAFPIGVGAVIKGWDDTLVGKKVGSRVVLVVPPALGYGSGGNSQAGIKGTDTLVFVVDLVAIYQKSVGSQEKATLLSASTNGVSITHLFSTAPVIKVAKGTKKPTKTQTILLARGSGAKVKAGMVILQFDAVDWTNKVLTSTWTMGTPDGEYLGSTVEQSVFESLIGDRIGGWVLIEIPANTNGGPYALAVHIVAEVPASAAK